MRKRFDHRKIEAKWQEHWAKSGIYDVGERDVSKEKEYVLVEWPYPSGNLHIGHWFAFAVTDIYVRAHRMQGKQVLFPMGFDAFGLPAENAAIKNDIDPNDWTKENVAFMTKQLKSMGNAFSWDKTANSTDPEYYKWTQWMFTKFFEKDIVYRGKGIVNWCPSCNTVLANEQVVDYHCERCGDEIKKREMEEWKMRITKYADRLVDDLDRLDWPLSIKESQRQWIGRSEGSEITFQLSTGDSLKVFTTRPDTLFGVTYMVISPEHPLLKKLEEDITNWDDVQTYVQKASKKTEIERTNLEKEKIGIKLDGVTATNPVSNKEIPVFVADYVLIGYGTGAIMAVPAHDDRDYVFAKKYDVAITQVITSKEALPYAGAGTLMNSKEFDGMDSEDAKAAITKKIGGEITNAYKLRDWSVGRQRYWGTPIPIVYSPEGKPHAIPPEHLPWHLPTDVDPKPTGEPPLAKSKELKERTEKIFGEGWTPEVETMDVFVDSSWYFLRYIDSKDNKEFSSPEHQKDWMPVDIYFGGAEHTTMHLLYSRFWQKVLYDLKLVAHDEPYVKRINRGLVLGPDGNKMSKSKGNVIDPDKQVEQLGADTVKMYLAFMGPYGEPNNYPWDMGGIAGIRRFLERVCGLREHVGGSETHEITRLLHKTIKKVSNDIDSYKYNTAISAMMVFVNKAERSGLSQKSYHTFLQLLAPFAPHLTEELWNADHERSIHLDQFPEFDEKFVRDTVVTIGVQINGKRRGEIDIDPNASEEEAMDIVKTDSILSGRVNGEVVKVIYRPGRILNIIIDE